MKVVNREYRLCLVCMEMHCVETVEISESVMSHGEDIVLRSIYEYCSIADELLETEDMIRHNRVALDNLATLN